MNERFVAVSTVMWSRIRKLLQWGPRQSPGGKTHFDTLLALKMRLVTIYVIVTHF